ncbi:MAG TPA: neutral zinc metallopeptidase [Methylomirabilota bacterium]|nr:neutral zinc metallopeptidase [Methylomirabilota bacterium]
MRWAGGRRSRNIEDRRGMGVPLGVVGGGLGTVVVLLLALFFGLDPGAILSTGDPELSVPSGAPPSTSAPADRQADFVSVVLADTEDTWAVLFREMNREYIPPKLVLFRTAAQSACGLAGSAVGPFYCPSDRRVYLDLDFFRELGERFRAPGDFAQAYVIAHEVGHHVQALLGITERVAVMQQRTPRREANALSVRVELQADCLAGVWAYHANESRQLLEEGDVEEGLRAAAAIGDDRLQRQAQGQVTPDSFTHGTSAQRSRWFKRGFDTGEMRRCDTFAASTL